MPGLNDLMQEICAGVEIFYTGRLSATYLNTAFILCDDYTELTAKLFLLTDDKDWSDQKATNRFKNYHDVLKDVEDVFRAKRNADLSNVQTLHTTLGQRRKERNSFFHSTRLLHTTLRASNCVDAFCDLMAYGRLLFPREWDTTLEEVANLDTLEIFLRLERCASADPIVAANYKRILALFSRQIPKPGKNDTYQDFFPDDIHFRLTVIYGSSNLKAQLKALLPP